MQPILLIAVGCVFLFNAASAQTKIYTCTDADGGVSYSQLPCKIEKPEEPDEPEPDLETERPTPAPAKLEPKSAAESSACKKRYRDAIDAIDAEIVREYSPDKAEQYKQRLLLLTRKLREC